MTIRDLFLVNNNWDKDTVLRLLNRDGSVYNNIPIKDMTEFDKMREVISFSGDTITLFSKNMG